MSLPNSLRLPLVAGVAFVLVACGGSAGSPTGSTAAPVDVGSGNLNGAGATFPEPFYTQAFYQYNQKNSRVSVNYQAIGSGGGIKQFTAGTVDFGASDVPMNAAELTAAGGESAVVEVPTILGVVSIAYNLPGADKLRLDGATLAGIFLGKVKTWDDPALKTLNPGVSLPGKPITVVHRSDGSGTSYQFTDYLSKVSSDWKSGPDNFVGDTYHMLSVEYRAPLVWIEHGYRTFPLYLRRIWGAAFTDAGNAFFGPFHPQDVKVGSGAEVHLQFNLAYYLEADLKIGFAHGFSAPGGDQVYVVAATTF